MLASRPSRRRGILGRFRPRRDHRLPPTSCLTGGFLMNDRAANNELDSSPFAFRHTASSIAAATAATVAKTTSSTRCAAGTPRRPSCRARVQSYPTTGPAPGNQDDCAFAPQGTKPGGRDRQLTPGFERCPRRCTARTVPPSACRLPSYTAGLSRAGASWHPASHSLQIHRLAWQEVSAYRCSLALSHAQEPAGRTASQ